MFYCNMQLPRIISVFFSGHSGSDILPHSQSKKVTFLLVTFLLSEDAILQTDYKLVRHKAKEMYFLQ